MRLRRVIYVTAAVAVGLGVATYAFLSTLNFDDLTALLQREVKAATGRDLVVAGPVDLQISLTPSIDLQDLRFANASWGSRPEMVTLRRLELEVDLMALLGGDIVVNRLVLVQPDILIETDAEGTGNWEFGSASAPSENDAPADSGGRDLPDIQDFAILGGRLTVADRCRRAGTLDGHPDRSDWPCAGRPGGTQSYPGRPLQRQSVPRLRHLRQPCATSFPVPGAVLIWPLRPAAPAAGLPAVPAIWSGRPLPRFLSAPRGRISRRCLPSLALRCRPSVPTRCPAMSRSPATASLFPASPRSSDKATWPAPGR